MNKKIVFWDNDGTIVGSCNPNDLSANAKTILPNVERVMQNTDYNFVISGIKSPESEMQNFDTDPIIKRFTLLMNKLPIHAVAFSPSIGGIHCYVIIKQDEKPILITAHEDPRYHSYIGQFKKPGIGMFVVLRDIATEYFNCHIDHSSSIMIGDQWQDEAAATSFGIPFIHAHEIHNNFHQFSETSNLWKQNEFFCSTFFEKASEEEKMVLLKKAYARAEQDQNRLETIKEWESIDTEK